MELQETNTILSNHLAPSRQKLCIVLLRIPEADTVPGTQQGLRKCLLSEQVKNKQSINSVGGGTTSFISTERLGQIRCSVNTCRINFLKRTDDKLRKGLNESYASISSGFCTGHDTQQLINFEGRKEKNKWREGGKEKDQDHNFPTLGPGRNFPILCI